MAGRLTEDQMDSLEAWISSGQKTFTLLYKITRDGCNSTTFHQKCDNQGATVTVLYNPSNTVYGGYTSTNWTGGQWSQDNSAFLFRLQYSGDVTKRTKLPVKVGNTQSVYSGYGPTFGGGHDLYTFNGTVPMIGGQFQLNGHVKIGTSYDTQGLTENDLNNRSMAVTDLEVYKVADGKRPKAASPWRKTRSWDESFQETLIEEIVNYKPMTHKNMNIKESRILLLGPVGAGKSSFFNTVQSIFMDRITLKGCSGSAEHSITTTYRQYQIQCRPGAPINVRLCDTRGLEEAYGLDSLELNYLLDGNVPDWYQFNSIAPISPETREFIKYPATGDKVHCVAFVIDSSTVEVMSEKVVENMKRVQTRIYEKGTPLVVLLTKVDKVCKEIEEDISKTFQSKAVKDLVDKVAQIFGVSRGCIFPIKNYEIEVDLDLNINIMTLLALRQMMNIADDYLSNCLDKIQAEAARKMKD